MNDIPQNPGAPGHDKDRDDELAARLNTYQVPEHGPTFWSDLEAIFEVETSTDAGRTQDRSPGTILLDTVSSTPAEAAYESATELPMADVLPLASPFGRSRMPMVLSAAAVVLLLAAGAAVLLSRLDNTTSIEAADSVSAADDTERRADPMGDGESPSTASDDQLDDDNTPAGADGDQVQGPVCSGAIELEPLSAAALERLDVPTELANTVAAIDVAAAQCDWTVLAAMTSSEFVASFGGGDAIELWSGQEQGGDGVMDDLRRVLRQPFAVSENGQIYSWPAVFGQTCVSFAEDEQSLVDQGYSEDDIKNNCAFIGGYDGYRTGFEASGKWIFFVAGD